MVSSASLGKNFKNINKTSGYGGGGGGGVDL